MPTPKFLELEDVLRIHDRQIQKFGGSPGIRDLGLLESALAQPQATFSGKLLDATVSEQAAAYLFHIAMNHPFLDGNKRTAFAVMDTFLRLNGVALNLTQVQKYEFVIQTVEGKLRALFCKFGEAEPARSRVKYLSNSVRSYASSCFPTRACLGFRDRFDWSRSHAATPS